MMPPFKKKSYTEPIISRHDNNIEKDWYVSFRFKHEGKIHKYKRREGVNRIRGLSERLKAIEELRDEIAFDLKHGWNPIFDPQREIDYNPYLRSNLDKQSVTNQGRTNKKEKHLERVSYYYNK
jgi:hypothetical protein